MNLRNLDEALDETPEPLTQEELQAAVSLLIPILFQKNGAVPTAQKQNLSPARKLEITELATIGQMPHLAEDIAPAAGQLNADLLREHFEKLQMQTCRLLYHGTVTLKETIGTTQHRLSLLQNLIVMLKLIFDLKQRSFCYLPEMTERIAPLFQLLEEVARNPQMALSDLVKRALPLLYQINLQLRAFASTHERQPDKVRKGIRKRASRASGASAQQLPTADPESEIKK